MGGTLRAAHRGMRLNGLNPNESERIEETTMIDPETGRPLPKPESHVFTATRMFGPDLVHHAVVVDPADFDRLRLFGLRIRRDLGRHYDRTNEILYSSQRRDAFERYRFDDGLEVVEHESLNSFFKAIGYSWSRNAYRAVEQLPLAA